MHLFRRSAMIVSTLVCNAVRANFAARSPVLVGLCAAWVRVEGRTITPSKMANRMRFIVLPATLRITRRWRPGLRVHIARRDPRELRFDLAAEKQQYEVGEPIGLGRITQISDGRFRAQCFASASHEGFDE